MVSVRLLYHYLRLFLWRHGILRLPAQPGWEALLRSRPANNVWPGGFIGAPLQWSLLTEQGGRYVAFETVCQWTGQAVSGADPARLGVRCARCGVPIAATAAGMATSFDVPSCPPCRRAVQNIVRES